MSSRHQRGQVDADKDGLCSSGHFPPLLSTASSCAASSHLPLSWLLPLPGSVRTRHWQLFLHQLETRPRPLYRPHQHEPGACTANLCLVTPTHHANSGRLPPLPPQVEGLRSVNATSIMSISTSQEATDSLTYYFLLSYSTSAWCLAEPSFLTLSTNKRELTCTGMELIR
jgi:hypothetical protein